MEMILASQSPRRKELLAPFKLPLVVQPSSFDESTFEYQGDPVAYVLSLAEKKAEAVSRHYPTALVIGADTIVYQEGKVFEKPKNAQEAIDMLCHLSGRWHTVYTAISVQQGEKKHSAVEGTRVQLFSLTPQMVHRYQKAIGAFDKAGGYAIQGAGYLIVKKIEGCYTNVMGLSLNLLRKLLLEFKVDLWSFL